jgi:tRNA (guanine-N7-)-methyltransferase
MFAIDFNKYPLPTRKRHHTNPNYYIPINDLNVVPNDYPQLITTIEWEKYFINSKPPIFIDIGCGRGLFLLTLADENSEKNILGVEVRSWCCQWLSNFIKKEKIQNCGILRYCVTNGLPFIASESIEEIYYLFPDPWVKQKHKKRRAYNLDFLIEVERLLMLNGRLYLATDILEVHKDHIKLLHGFGKFDFKEIHNDAEWGKPPTNKELFCKRENIPYYRIIASKK